MSNFAENSMLMEEKCDFNDELQFFIHNLDTFYKLFPDKWVGIRNHQVIAMGDSIQEMENHARQRGYASGSYQPQRCGKDKWCYTIIAR